MTDRFRGCGEKQLEAAVQHHGMNFLRKLISSAPTDEVVQLPSGKLFLTRSPQLPKGELECLYNDAFISIRQTTTPFFYRLLVTRVYHEGELSSHGDGGDTDDDDDDSEFGGTAQRDLPRLITDLNAGVGHSKDEYGFGVVEELKCYCYDREDGSRAISWRDLNGDLGDRFEFVIDEECKPAEIDLFMFALYKCQYENKYHKLALGINLMALLREFVYDPRLELLTLDDLADDWLTHSDSEEEFHDATGGPPLAAAALKRVIKVPRSPRAARAGEAKGPAASSSASSPRAPSPRAPSPRAPKAPEARKAPQEGSSVPARAAAPADASLPSGSLYTTTLASLHKFDPLSETFKLVAATPLVRIVDAGDWQYRLIVRTAPATAIETPITKEINPTFNYEYFSFVFNFAAEGVLSSYLLKFGDFNELSDFQTVFMKQLWQLLHRTTFGHTQPELAYVIDAFSQTTLEDKGDLSERDRQDIDAMSDDDMDVDAPPSPPSPPRAASRRLFVDLDSDAEDDAPQMEGGVRNQNLLVGFANDRLYVARGDKLGVFKNEDDELAFQTTISGLTTLAGKSFTPTEAMLHMQDRFLIMQNPLVDDKKLFKMDLERGKIVEEWQVSRNHAVESFGPNTKFLQLTAEQTLTGLSANGMFRIDPRLNTQDKLVDDNTFKLYKTKNNAFLLVATTQQGGIAVGSKRGDIRLYDRLGINAKTALPSLGEPIKGIDVSADGRWLLATCDTFLLLLDLKVGEGQRNEGHLGFNKPFDKDKKPTPRRLAIKPEHAAYMFNESGGKPLSFTKAHFNTGLSSTESVIVTSSGPYLITWSMKKVLQPKPAKGKGPEEAYLIKKYLQDVIADNFKFGSNADVILALLDDVAMAKKSGFRRPTRDNFGGGVVEEY